MLLQTHTLNTSSQTKNPPRTFNQKCGPTSFPERISPCRERDEFQILVVVVVVVVVAAVAAGVVVEK
eukprot:1302726-Amphidinium_carterae.1